MNGVHRRWNPLTRRWVLVSPHRTQRPWQGQEDAPAAVADVAYDPGCYLCPGNVRANGETNPAYAGTFAFGNDFAALLPEVRERVEHGSSLLRAEPEAGICRVLCYSPDHSLTMARMTVEQIRDVIGMWRAEYAALAGVRRVTISGYDGAWQQVEVKLEPTTDAREEIAALARDQHWPVREISRSRTTLEDVFVEITQRD